MCCQNVLLTDSLSDNALQTMLLSKCVDNLAYGGLAVGMRVNWDDAMHLREPNSPFRLCVSPQAIIQS